MTTGYLVFATKQLAQDRSHAEAVARGCAIDGTTQWWWDIVENPLVPGQFLLLLDDTRPGFEASGLSADEQALVQADPAVLAALT